MFWNHQKLWRLYAADPGTGGGGAAADPAPGAAQEGEAGKPSAFDTFLADPKNQAEFDRRVGKALETAQARFESQQQAAIDEALKVQKMTDDQKADYNQKQMQKQLDDRDAELTRRELRLNAIDTINQKGLPVELADALSYTNAEDCEKSLKSVAKAFEKAVAKAVDDKLRQDPPPAGNPNTGDAMAAVRAAAGL